ncbi:MAG TPA: hypothetical protein VMW27_00395, partial [Thermoanaerobaculia bacterium]|nr:hypothetical protein [Thermoanaerobaculia bacterium]
MKRLWISTAILLFLLASSLSAQSNRELRGKVFHLGENGYKVLERNLIVTLDETGDSDETSDLGIFRLPLSSKLKPG